MSRTFDRKGIDVLLFWPVDEKAMHAGAREGGRQGHPDGQHRRTTSSTSPAVTGNAYVDQWASGTQVAHALRRKT